MTKYRIRQTIYKGDVMFQVERRFLWFFWVFEEAGYSKERALRKLEQLKEARRNDGNIVYEE